MEILRTVEELRQWRGANRQGGGVDRPRPHDGRVARGPTASLIELLRLHAGGSPSAFFVNPTQFGPNEDFARYPRTFDADCAIVQAEGANVIFAPFG